MVVLTGTFPGPARPLGELGDHLGRQPLWGTKDPTEIEKIAEKLKINSHAPKSPSDSVVEGRQMQVLPRVPKWPGPVLLLNASGITHAKTTCLFYR